MCHDISGDKATRKFQGRLWCRCGGSLRPRECQERGFRPAPGRNDDKLPPRRALIGQEIRRGLERRATRQTPSRPPCRTHTDTAAIPSLPMHGFLGVRLFASSIGTTFEAKAGGFVGSGWAGSIRSSRCALDSLPGTASNSRALSDNTGTDMVCSICEGNSSNAATQWARRQIRRRSSISKRKTHARCGLMNSWQWQGPTGTAARGCLSGLFPIDGFNRQPEELGRFVAVRQVCQRRGNGHVDIPPPADYSGQCNTLRRFAL